MRKIALGMIGSAAMSAAVMSHAADTFKPPRADPTDDTTSEDIEQILEAVHRFPSWCVTKENRMAYLRGRATIADLRRTDNATFHNLISTEQGRIALNVTDADVERINAAKLRRAAKAARRQKQADNIINLK